MRLLRPPSIDLLSLVLLTGALAIILAPQTRISSDVRAAIEIWRQDRAVREHWPIAVSMALPLDSGYGAGHVIEVIQYACDACVGAAQLVDSVRSDSVGISLLHLPPRNDSSAIRAAAIAVCGARVGVARKVHEWLVSDSSWRSRNATEVMAATLGLRETATLMGCVESEAWRPIIAAHGELARRLGVRYTPFFFFANGALHGPPSRSSLLHLSGVVESPNDR